MKAKNICLIILICLLTSVGELSCKKLIGVDPPPNELVTSSVFKDSTSAVSAVRGIYIEMINVSTVLQFGNGGITLYTALSADELYPTLNYDAESEFFHNYISRENGINAGLWIQAYKIIYNANACITGLSQSELPEQLKLRLLCDARLVRAFIYFHLVQLYGDVPYVTSIQFEDNSKMPRILESDILRNIEQELDSVIPLMTGNETGKITPNRYTAMALLARLYLYEKKWQQAEHTASLIIDSGNYALEPFLQNTFRSQSSETIWHLPAMQPDYETAEAYTFIPGSPDYPPAYAVSAPLLAAFENNDLRKRNWLDSLTVDGDTFYYPYKYTIGYDGNNSSEEPYVIFRLAEQYLIRSEAKAHQNKIAEALSDLNLIRSRAGLSPIDLADQSLLLTSILKERRTELFCEWGQRWFDLKRTDNTMLLFPFKPNWQESAALYPIPYSEIQLNPFLSQNPGY
ncbi:MAG TPA: RagB/SusD family nutrient uptake outer membrane protein [Agriterribacter sp.]|nr:RagB/SusD family nutrient uptake outer membrane protein [Agriterribacter sp.]HRQ49443.1 RagB/SusD family nutrient uptake outer membrane protein [Agriterribacter sp.]